MESESKGDNKNYNRLMLEKSPYLLQHARNPVDWYPWGEEAFTRAREEHKPIFLSIGYSTCHWCHVMEHESFEDREVARLMNEVFVSIKVDREERPDIDNIYMTVCQLLTGSGGWPLSIVMTPDKKPFFAATYIPRETRFGRIGMLELIPRIADVWKRQHDRVIDSANQITDALREVPEEGRDTLGEPVLKGAFEQLAKSFDEHHGGFGASPKFPTPHQLIFLLRYWKRTENRKALDIVESTLMAMRQGGIYDHIGLGFHRYSTDAQWLVPHFEKMLYDQALLAIAYAEGYQATGRDDFKKTAHEIIEYVLRDMRSSEGGFYSAEDADSEGIEGKFYLWTEEEIRRALKSDEADLIVQFFNIKGDGNFTDEFSGEISGSNIIHMRESTDAIASSLHLSKQELEKRIAGARGKLFKLREKRIHPHRDDKVLTDWNGLMIAALARCAQVFDEQRYADAARDSINFILGHMRSNDGRLLHRYRDGQAAIPAHLNDYVFLIWGLLELYDATFDTSSLKTAVELNEDLITHFWDHSHGGFYFSADDAEKLFMRQKEIYDGAVPSGNSIAMWNLLRLARITANSQYEEKAEQIGRVFSKQVTENPSAYTQLMVAVDFSVGPLYEVVIAGDPGAPDTRAMLKALRKYLIPNKVVLLRPGEERAPDIASLAGFTRDQRSIEGRATAYVCHNYSCKLPTTEIDTMLKLLKVSNR
jgi:uncharacterized protein YyaL (SSP411 family)